MTSPGEQMHALVERAERLIRIRDGQIEDDVRTAAAARQPAFAR